MPCSRSATDGAIDGEELQLTGMNRLVIRAPNHLGEIVLSLPALGRAVSDERKAGRVAPLVQVVSWLAPVLRWAIPGVDVLPLDNRHAVWTASRALRLASDGCSLRGVTLTPSFSSAVILRLAGVTTLRGTAGEFRTRLLTDAIDRRPLLGGHRVDEFLTLLGFSPGDVPPPPVIRDSGIAQSAWNSAVRRLSIPAGSAVDGPVIGMCPGANGRSRRWPADRFGELATRLASVSRHILVFGGGDDALLTGPVAKRAGERGIDLGGRTSLVELAGALLSCDLLVTNDTGPMHLAAALGVPVLALEGPADVRQTRPLGSRVRLVGRFDLPCVPCVKNECPRRGPGYELVDAERECLRLIEVDDVEAAARSMLNAMLNEELT